MPIPQCPPLPQTKWPTIIGVICIVLGSMGVLSSPMQLLSPMFTKMSLQVYVQQGAITAEQIDAHFEKWGSVQLILGLVVGIVSLCMLLGGIFLAKRKKKGALILKVWSILFII